MKEMSVEDEVKVLEEARTGSRQAFSQLVRLHQGRVRAYLGRYLRGDDLVDDLAQDAFFDAYRSLDTYRGEVPFRLWLLGIARNRALRYLRQEHRGPKKAGGSLGADMDGWLAESLEAHSSDVESHDRKLSALRRCMEGLPEGSARLVSDFYFNGRPATQIARESGRSEGGLWVTLVRIRKALRHCVEMRLRTAEGV